AGQFNLSAARHSLLPIPMFLLGVLAGTLLMQADRRRALPRLSVLVAAMLAVGVAAAYFAWPGWMSIVILSFAMGMMNTSILQVGGQTVGIGYMTGDLNNLAQHLALGIRNAPVAQAQGSWDTHWRRASLLAGLWIAFLSGAVLGASCGSRFAVWTLLLPAAMLLVLAVAERDTISEA
ncbi:MAG TPA: YoaK family protein, partial [Candidatus Acidoferrales bacterium]|nr:YoaK family protein [Candidatus Acidoferrales bacterium]